jgi:hypothetical protein
VHRSGWQSCSGRVRRSRAGAVAVAGAGDVAGGVGSAIRGDRARKTGGLGVAGSWSACVCGSRLEWEQGWRCCAVDGDALHWTLCDECGEEGKELVRTGCPIA